MRLNRSAPVNPLRVAAILGLVALVATLGGNQISLPTAFADPVQPFYSTTGYYALDDQVFVNRQTITIGSESGEQFEIELVEDNRGPCSTNHGSLVLRGRDRDAVIWFGNEPPYGTPDPT